MDLDQIRKDIDQIDQELVALLERRMVCVGQIGMLTIPSFFLLTRTRQIRTCGMYWLMD